MSITSAIHNQACPSPKKSFLREWGFLIVVVAIILLSRIFIWSTVRVDGSSMDPNLADNQRLVMTKIGNFSRGDIVVAKESLSQTRLNESGANSGKTIVKRVIGLPGDTLVFHDDTLSINGENYSQAWLKEYQEAFNAQKLGTIYKTSLELSGATGEELKKQRNQFSYNADTLPAFTINSSGSSAFTVKVPEGKYFLLGDNRIVSADSRKVGFFSKNQIQGKVVFRFWPVTKFGIVD